MPSQPNAQLPRRALLIASGVGALGLVSLAGCGGEDQEPESIPIEPTAPEVPDENLLDELALIGAYLGAIEVFPEMRGSLTAIADQHKAHARELGATTEQLDAVAPIPPAAARLKPAIGELIARERAAAQLRADAAITGTDAARIRAFTFIAASESSHIPELRDLRTNA